MEKVSPGHSWGMERDGYIMAKRLYCDFPNGQRVHVFRVGDLLPYALEFGTPVRVVDQKRGCQWSEPRFYEIVGGKMKKVEPPEDEDFGLEPPTYPRCD